MNKEIKWIQDGGLHHFYLNNECQDTIKFAPYHCWTDQYGNELSPDIESAKRIIEYKFP